MATELEQSMRDLCDKHGLTSVHIGYHTNISSGSQYVANVHWNGFARDGIACEHGSGPDVRTALRKAIEAAAVNRSPDVPEQIAGEALPELAA